jgi:hypothetical protein
MQRFDLSDEVPWLTICLFKKEKVMKEGKRKKVCSVDCLRYPISFFENPRIRANGYYYTLFHFHTLLPVTELIIEGVRG